MGFQIENGVLKEYKEEPGVTDVVIPEGVTRIGNQAFMKCKTLTSVVILEGVTNIGDGAFWECRSLTSVTIPESVTRIGEDAFLACESLTSITIPKSVTSIGDGAFNGCKSLISITLPDSVTGIEGRLFRGCEGLTSVVIHEGVTSIGIWAFNGCKSLTSVTLPESVTSIGNGAFGNCVSLTGITIPEGVTDIKQYAFSGCGALTDLAFPKSMERIESYAFDGCSSLTSVTFGGGPASPGLTVIEGLAFTGCSALKHITVENTSIGCHREEFVFHGYNFVDHSAQVDAVVIGRMTESTNELLYQAKGIARIFSPDMPISEISAKRKAALAYLETPNAYSPDVAEGYRKYIAGQPKWALPYIFRQDRADLLEAFAAGKKIKASNIDQMYLEPAMAANALQCVAYLLNWKGTHVTSAQQDKLWERELMKAPCNREDMAKLWSWEKLDDGTLRLTRYKGTDTHVEIPDHIGTAAVSRLDDLFAPKTERGGKKVNAAVLNAVSSVAIPDSITVHSRTFRGCRGLADQNGFIILRNVLYDYIGTASKVTIPHGVVAIDRAFGNDPEYLHFNHKLRQVEIPETVVEIGAGAFQNCVELKKVILHAGLQRIGVGAFDYCRNLTDIVLPDSVTEVGEDAFMYCKSLTDIVLPDSVTEIGESAFMHCESLTGIVLPEGVPSLERYVFGYCESLKSVTIPQSVTAIARTAFSHCRGFVICAPAGSYAETYAKKNSIPFQALD